MFIHSCRVSDRLWQVVKGFSSRILPQFICLLGRRASIKAIEVSNFSITSTTAYRFSRLNIASCSALLLFGSPHSMLRIKCQRRSLKELFLWRRWFVRHYCTISIGRGHTFHWIHWCLLMCRKIWMKTVESRCNLVWCRVFSISAKPFIHSSPSLPYSAQLFASKISYNILGNLQKLLYFFGHLRPSYIQNYTAGF